MSDKVSLARSDSFFDVLINGVKRGSGSWSLVDTAVIFYQLENMEVKVYE